MVSRHFWRMSLRLVANGNLNSRVYGNGAKWPLSIGPTIHIKACVYRWQRAHQCAECEQCILRKEKLCHGILQLANKEFVCEHVCVCVEQEIARRGAASNVQLLAPDWRSYISEFCWQNQIFVEEADGQDALLMGTIFLLRIFLYLVKTSIALNFCSTWFPLAKKIAKDAYQSSRLHWRLMPIY